MTTMMIISIVKIILLITLLLYLYAFSHQILFHICQGLKFDVRSLCHSSEYSMLGLKYLQISQTKKYETQTNIRDSNLMLDNSKLLFKF